MPLQLQTSEMKAQCLAEKALLAFVCLHPLPVTAQKFYYFLYHNLNVTEVNLLTLFIVLFAR